MTRPGLSGGQAVLALVLAVPIALLLVVTFSPFKRPPEVEPPPELSPPRPKAKTPPKATKGDSPKVEPPSPPPPTGDGPELEVAPPPREVPEQSQIP